MERPGEKRKGMELTVATFNLKHDHIAWLSTHWSKRTEAVKQFFEETAPDVVGTQELTRRTIGDMEALLPEYDWIGQGRNGGEQGEYCAVFFKRNRFEWLDKGTFWLARNEQKKGTRDWMAVLPRICTWVLLREKETGEKLLVYNTHLDHISPIARRKGLDLIARHIQRQGGRVPCILTGDFNATPGSGAIRVLEEMDIKYGLFSGNSYNLFLNTQGQRTYHGFHGKTVGKPVDYIFTSKEVEIVEARIVQDKYDGRYPSDHFPIVMKISVSPLEQEKTGGTPE